MNLWKDAKLQFVEQLDNLNLVVMIMRIEHIAMYVNDLEATKESFFKYKRDEK